MCGAGAVCCNLQLSQLPAQTMKLSQSTKQRFAGSAEAQCGWLRSLPRQDGDAPRSHGLGHTPRKQCGLRPGKRGLAQDLLRFDQADEEELASYIAASAACSSEARLALCRETNFT